jgi:hypothetical protein
MFYHSSGFLQLNAGCNIYTPSVQPLEGGGASTPLFSEHWKKIFQTLELQLHILTAKKRQKARKTTAVPTILSRHSLDDVGWNPNCQMFGRILTLAQTSIKCSSFFQR